MMAKFYYRYGAMQSSKSMNLLMTAHNYESQGKDVLVFTSGLDDRSGNNRVESRVGPSRPAHPVYPETNIYDIVKDYQEEHGSLYAVLLDEVQFYKEHHIHQMSRVTDELDIPVLAYGLKTDFRGQLFEGSKALFEQADKFIEVKTVCVFCNKKATHNLRTSNNYPVYTGDQIQVGDEEYYPVCRKHHRHPETDNRGALKLMSQKEPENVIE